MTYKGDEFTLDFGRIAQIKRDFPMRQRACHLLLKTDFR